jgi:hypothetical protein
MLDASQGNPNFVLSSSGATDEAWLGPPCARRTTTASSWGFREQGGPRQATLTLTFPSQATD